MDCSCWGINQWSKPLCVTYMHQPIIKRIRISFRSYIADRTIQNFFTLTYTHAHNTKHKYIHIFHVTNKKSSMLNLMIHYNIRNLNNTVYCSLYTSKPLHTNINIAILIHHPPTFEYIMMKYVELLISNLEIHNIWFLCNYWWKQSAYNNTLIAWGCETQTQK